MKILKPLGFLLVLLSLAHLSISCGNGKEPDSMLPYFTPSGTSTGTGTITGTDSGTGTGTTATGTGTTGTGTGTSTGTGTGTSTATVEIRCNPVNTQYPTGWVGFDAGQCAKVAGTITHTRIENEYDNMKNGFIKIDTSAIPAGAIIKSAAIYYYGVAARGGSSFRLGICREDPDTVSDPALVFNEAAASLAYVGGGCSVNTWSSSSFGSTMLAAVEAERARHGNWIAFVLYTC
ncbi:MAG: hypothetical protein ACYS8W_11705 [Planctomycetota bacterium]|jgi:hypothetical protein